MTQNERILNRFEDWWRGELTGLPLMYVAAVKDEKFSCPKPETPAEYYLDIEYLLRRFECWMENHVYLADAFPSFSADLGPGSLALYLGGEPDFQWDTVWYKECITDLEGHPPLAYDAQNPWWHRHFDMMKRAKEASGGRFRVNIPDIIENIDILAAMRGTQNTLYDIMDEPERVARRLGEIDKVYFAYYDAMYELLKEADGSSSYTAFHIQGRGRVAKIQCDFSAMLSPKQFRDFIIPSLEKQTLRLDHSLYHLDGPDAIRHVPALMELTRLTALQWTCGAGQPDGGCERWWGIYDDVTGAGKGLWIQIYDGGVDDWIRSAERLLGRYGKNKIYFVFPDMSLRDAEILMEHAQRNW